MKSRFYLSTALSLVAGVAIVGVLSLHGGIFDRSTVINPGNLYPVLNFDNHGDGVYTFTARLADGYVYVSGPFCDSPGWTLSGETAILIYNSELDGNLASYFPVNIYGSFMPVGPGTEPPPIWNYNAEGRLTDYDYDVSPDYAQVDLDATDPSAEFHSTLADIPCPSDWTATLTSGPGQWSQTGTGESFVVRPEQPGEYEIRGEYEDQYDTARLDAFRLQWEFDPNVIAVGKTAPVKFFLEGPEGVHKLYTFSIDPAAKATLGNGPALDLDTRKHDLLVNGIAASGVEEDTSIRNDQNPKIVPFTVVDMNPYLFEDFVIVDHPDEETVFVEFRPILVSKGTFTVTLTAPGNGAMTAEDDMGKLLTSGVPLVYDLTSGDEIPLWFDIKREGNAGGVATFSFVYDGGAEYAKLEKTLDVDVYKLIFDPAPITLYVGEEKDVKAKLEGPPKALGMLYTTEDCQHVVPVAMQVAHQAGAEVEIKIIGIKPSDEEPDGCSLLGVFPDDRSMSVDIEVKSAKVDLDMPGVPDQTENDNGSGGFVMVNDDDDNENGKIDHLENGAESSEFQAVHISWVPDKDDWLSFDAATPLRLSLRPVISAGSYVRVWKKVGSGYALLIDGQGDYDFTRGELMSIGKTVYVEGFSPGASRLTLRYENPKLPSALEDRLKVTAVKNDIHLEDLKDEDGEAPFELSRGAFLPVNVDGDRQLLKKLTVRRPRPTSANHIPADGSVILSWSPGIEIYSAKDLASQKLANPATIPFAQLAAEYYVNLIEPSEAPRDRFIKTTYVSPNNAAICEDEIRITSLLLDLDVDSDNDGIIEDHNGLEDAIECLDPDTHSDKLGKIVDINDDDKDGDGKLDCFDYEIKGGTFDENIFSEVRLRLPEGLDIENMWIKLSYSDSVPPADGAAEELPAHKSLRLWTKASNISRHKSSVKNGGHFIASSTNRNETWYEPSELGFKTGMLESTFFLEAVKKGFDKKDTSVITVSIMPKDSTTEKYAGEDRIRVYPIHIADLTIHLPKIIDSSEPAIEEADEMIKGGVTFVNLDNDDGDETFDDSDSDVVGGDNELVKLTLRLNKIMNTGVVKLSAVAGSGDIKIYKSDDKRTTYNLGDELPVASEFTDDGNSLVKELWVEGIKPHTTQRAVKLRMKYVQQTRLLTFDDVALTVLGIDKIEYEGIGNSLNNDDTLTNDTNWPTGLAPGALCVFPGARANSSGKVETKPRNTVYVKVTLSVETPYPVYIFLKSFDTDDPTADKGPIDDPGAAATTGEQNQTDNRGTPVAGEFNRAQSNGLKKLKLIAGKKDNSVSFTVSMQPGDNFRVCGNADESFMLRLENNDKEQNVGTTDSEKNENKQRICRPKTGASDAASPADREVRNTDNYCSKVITVWRFLHVEMDSMAAPPATGSVTNTVDGIVTGISGTATTATKITVDQSLDDGSASPGRFENGWIRLGTALILTGLDGNGASYVERAAGFAIPAGIAKVGKSDLPSQVMALSGRTYTLSATPTVEEYIGGTITVAGVSSTITSVTPGVSPTVTVSANPNIPFNLHDDDVDTILPALPVVDREMVDLFAPAYILPVRDGGGKESNNSEFVPFRRNIKRSEYDAVLKSANALQSESNRLPRFWCAYVLNAFQSSAKPEQIGAVGPGNPPRGDVDPNIEKILPGVNRRNTGAFVFMECLRDKSLLSHLHRITTHEIAHQLGAVDTYISGTPTPDDDMMAGGIYKSTGAHFYGQALHDMRSTINPNK